ncbi:MAG: flagellar motor protein [Bacillota bacterium]|nr:flagellar motor protein [Bacillota bacterium]
MDISSIIGLITGLGALIIAFLMEGGNLSSLVLPSPFITVFGGTLGAVFLSYRIDDIKKIPKLFMQAMKKSTLNTEQEINTLVAMSEQARREGLLSLEPMISDNQQEPIDPLLKRGITMVIDGVGAQEIHNMLETEIYVAEQSKRNDASIFESAGGFSPTMGVIGTVMGLIHVLSNMGAADELAASIATAFIATFYGVSFANLIYIPIASKLKLQIKSYKMEKEMIIEGILGIRNGENPKILRERLEAYVIKNSTKPKGEVEK